MSLCYCVSSGSIIEQKLYFRFNDPLNDSLLAHIHHLGNVYCGTVESAIRIFVNNATNILSLVLK